MTTAAQNMHVFLRKSPLCRSHFFEWLKTANLSTACGTVTLKSPLSQAFFVPDVHPRLRKHLARCTLDCGFQTPESPALRGFEAERGPITGTSLYLVLKSNGLRHSKNLPVKFGFSPRTVPANIAKKLPAQRCSKPHFIAFFSLSHKRPTFAFTGESGYTLGSPKKIAHKGTHGETRGVLDGGWYHYPRSVPHVLETLRGRGLKRQTLPLLGLGRGCSQRTQRAFGTAMRLCASLFRRRRGPAGLRDLFRFCRNCGLYILCSGLSACMGQGWYHYPQCALRAAETPDGRLSKRLICRFLRSGGRSSPHDSYFLANTQNFLLAVPVANAFALWYDKFSKFEFAPPKYFICY